MGLREKARYFFQFLKNRVAIATLKTQEFLHTLYIRSGLRRVIYFLKFLFHHWGPEQFELIHLKQNEILLLEFVEGQWFQATREGKLSLVENAREARWFRLKNALFFGAFQKRVERAIYYTFLTLCLEVHNPFTINILEDYVQRKTALLERILKKLKKVNGQEWDDYQNLPVNIEYFKRSSMVQERVIEGVVEAVKKTPQESIIEDVRIALKSGLYPLLVIQGLSGTYWMRGTNREIAGLFKPFDEEAFAPNNPGGPPMQGALGRRRMRPGIRVGECIHREVAAYHIDQFFGFGIVPKTYYATFTHHVFFQAGSLVSAGGLVRTERTKMGSFQEYIEGFVTLIDLPQSEWKIVPEIEVQLLILLDVIIGNCDRNMGNILVGEEKIAAIDHGLCFSDLNLNLSTWYWKLLEPGKKEFPPAIVELLKNFPFEKVRVLLEKKCHIDLPAFERLRERVFLFREGILRGQTPAFLADLFSDDNMFLLYGLHDTLPQKVNEILDKYVEEKKAKAVKSSSTY